ncbi:MAG: class I SAM-dependent methyltransferase, partial [Planctomycetota bacterium]
MLRKKPTGERIARSLFSLSVALCGVLAAGVSALAAGSRTTRAKLPEAGLLVHVGCGTGSQTVRLAKGGSFVVHGLEKDAGKVERAQRLVRSNGLCGRVSVEQWTSSRLPYADNTVNLLIAPTTGAPSQKEVMRVLCPGGVAKIGSKTTSKPWPKEFDGWTHIRHGPDGNPVSTDTAVALPRNIRWVAPKARNRLPMLTANGRNFYGQVFVRDAFNGLPLWEKRRFTPHVATDDLLYGIEGSSVAVLDAAGGKSLGKFGSADRETSILLIDDTLVVATRSEVRAHDARKSRPRWSVRTKSPKCVVAGGGKVFFVGGDPKRGDSCSAVCLDLSTGKEGWRSEAYSWLKKAKGCSYGNGSLVYELSSFNDNAPGNTVHLLSAKDGKHMWSHSYKPGMAHNKQTKAFFLGKDLWIHSSGFTRLDLRSGKPAQKIRGGGGHCFSAVATVRFLLAGELNFTDVLTGKHERNAITKGECGWGGTFPGWIPANGLLYTFKGCRSHCICYPMIEGCLGLAPSRTGAARSASTSRGALVKGPGYGKTPPKTPKDQAALEWPCYRHDPWRSGGTSSPVDGKIRMLWATPAASRDGPAASPGRSGGNPFADEWKGNPFVMGPVTPPVVAGGLVIVGLTDVHRVVAMDAATGKVRWSYTANG